MAPLAPPVSPALGWNFDSSLDLLPDTVSECGPHQTTDSKEESVKDILLK